MNFNLADIKELRSDEIGIALTDAIETIIGKSLNHFPGNIRSLHDEFVLLLANYVADQMVTEEFEDYETERRISEYEMRFL